MGKVCKGCGSFDPEKPKGGWTGTCNKLGIGRNPDTPGCEHREKG